MLAILILIMLLSLAKLCLTIYGAWVEHKEYHQWMELQRQFYKSRNMINEVFREHPEK